MPIGKVTNGSFFYCLSQFPQRISLGGDSPSGGVIPGSNKCTTLKIRLNGENDLEFLVKVSFHGLKFAQSYLKDYEKSIIEPISY